jgi:hypothetical protein
VPASTSRPRRRPASPRCMSTWHGLYAPKGRRRGAGAACPPRSGRRCARSACASASPSW